MQRAEAVRLLVFTGLVVTVYVLAASVLFRWAFQRFGRIALSSSRQRWLRCIILGLAAFGLLCIAYGYYIEPYWLAVTHIRINSPKLAPAARPIRLAPISELACDARVRLCDRLP